MLVRSMLEVEPLSIKTIASYCADKWILYRWRIQLGSNRLAARA